MNTSSALTAVSRVIFGHRSGGRSVDETFHAKESEIEPHARRWVSTTQSYARTHPVKSLALLVAFGMVMRHILRR